MRGDTNCSICYGRGDGSIEKPAEPGRLADAPKQDPSPSSPAAEVREAFEAAISASPYERSVSRYPDDATRSSWPGNYRDIAVDLAWCMWQEAWRLSTSLAQQDCSTCKHTAAKESPCATCMEAVTIYRNWEPKE